MSLRYFFVVLEGSRYIGFVFSLEFVFEKKGRKIGRGLKHECSSLKSFGPAPIQSHTPNPPNKYFPLFTIYNYNCAGGYSTNYRTKVCTILHVPGIGNYATHVMEIESLLLLSLVTSRNSYKDYVNGHRQDQQEAYSFREFLSRLLMKLELMSWK
jgi:hypothetical protein